MGSLVIVVSLLLFYSNGERIRSKKDAVNSITLSNKDAKIKISNHAWKDNNKGHIKGTQRKQIQDGYHKNEIVKKTPVKEINIFRQGQKSTQDKKKAGQSETKREKRVKKNAVGKDGQVGKTYGGSKGKKGNTGVEEKESKKFKYQNNSKENNTIKMKKKENKNHQNENKKRKSGFPI